MSVIGSLQNLTGLIRVQASRASTPALKPFAPVDIESRLEALKTRTQLLRLYQSLENLAEVAGVEPTTRFGGGLATSATSLSLDLTDTAASLSSSDEINNAPMSFSPFGPEWDGSSTAAITIGGEYEGDHGSGNLLFEVRRAGTRGVDDLRIRIYDPNGDRIRNINIRASHAFDRQYDLRNGLYLTLGNGDLTNRDTATIEVRDDVGAAVDPDRPLGGIRNDNPNLQFGGPAIVDGEFTVNGETITVATSDSINDVIARINQSAAGVTAFFNTATERIDFTSDTPGSSGVIELQGDTANFFAATRLDSINVVDGIDPDTRRAIEQVAAFGSVQSGDIIINGTEISVDTAVDSLDDVIARINASDAGVNASFDTGSQQFQLEALSETERLSIDGNSTGLFAALNLLENNDYTVSRADGYSRQRSYRIADSFANVFDDLNDVFRRYESAGAPLVSALRGALGSDFGNGIFGLIFNDSADARRRGDFATMDRRDFTSNLQYRGDAVDAVLNDREGRSGLVNGLLRATEQALSIVNSTLNLRGTFIDTVA